MALTVQGQVGPQTLQDGASQPFRQGKTGCAVVVELHGRFFEQAYRGNLFSGGMTLTSISNVTFTTGTLGATCTPIVGLWNPGTSKYNLAVLQASLGVAITAATSTGGGPFAWAVSTGNNVITTGSTPWSRLTLAQGGSLAGAKFFAGAALTGMTNNLVVMMGSALTGGSAGNYSQVDTAVGFSPAVSGASTENLDSSIIVPPGGVLALLATTTPVAHSAVSGIIWEEVAV